MATSAEYWIFCSPSAPSSALCLAAGLSGKGHYGPHPASASCLDTPRVLGTSCSHHRARAVSPRGTGITSGDSTALVVVGPAAPAGGQVVTGPGNDSLARLGRSGAMGTPEAPGAVFVLIRDRCAPPHPTRPRPSQDWAAPLPLQGWAGRVPEGLLARCAQTEKLGGAGQRGSSLPLTSLGCPKQSQRALPPRCAHLRGRTALGLDGSASPRLWLRFCAPGPVPLTALAGPRRAAARARRCLWKMGRVWGVGCGGNGQWGASPEHVGAWAAPGKFPVSLWRDRSWGCAEAETVS